LWKFVRGCDHCEVADNDVFKTALDVAEKRLRDAMAERDRVQHEVQNLMTAVNGLRAVLGINPRPPSPARPTGAPMRGGGPVAVTASGEIRVKSFSPGAGGEVVAEPSSGKKVIRVRSTGSTRRVARILDEVGTPLTSADLFEQFNLRGWIEQGWSTPEAAVTQAARRAASLGLIGRDGRFWLPKGRSDESRQPSDSVQPETLEEAERSMT
jgi:hypothetical protein